MEEKKRHLLVVSQYFYPEEFRINDMCQEWVRRGYKVTVLTGIPNYPYGKFFEGYGYHKRRKEIWKGISIIRIPLIPRGRSAFGMFANYISFVISGFLWKCITKVRADIVFTFEVSPMSQALIGVWYAKKFKVPNLLYVQDLWPENVEVVTGIHSSIIIAPIRKMTDYIYKNCTGIFATSQSFVEEICKRGIEKEKVHFWPQYAEDFYKPLPKIKVKEIPDEEVFKIIFTGNIGYAQGLDILPKTAKILKTKGINVLFCIVGTGRYLGELEKEIADGQVQDMFLLIPKKSAERIPELMSVCDAAFLSFADVKLFEMTIPAKLQSYMACGMPIIAAASGETEKIIDAAKCGVCSPIGDIEMLVNKIEQMIAMSDSELKSMRENAMVYFENNFGKMQLMNAMDEYLR